METTNTAAEIIRSQFGNRPSFQEAVAAAKAKREAEKAAQQPKE